jgi:thiosulfate/3-mercaptopyruvate sulfurtransferase
MEAFAQPDVLVSTDWVAGNVANRQIAIVEVDVDTSLYNTGHIENARGWSWRSQLCDTVRRDIVSRAELEALLGASGISNSTTIVLYGDNNNWFAAWAFWQLKLYGHRDVRIMDGGRFKWEKESRPLTTSRPAMDRTTYTAGEPDASLRVFLPEVQTLVSEGSVELVDVRSPAEFTGEILAPPGLPETCQRGGHIPGASNIPWSKTVDEEDGTFKSRSALRSIYTAEGITGERPIITYCRIGERSSHSWFVLKYLIGYEVVRNYDGSWTEWGNLVGAPVERGERVKA